MTQGTYSQRWRSLAVRSLNRTARKYDLLPCRAYRNAQNDGIPVMKATSSSKSSCCDGRNSGKRISCLSVLSVCERVPETTIENSGHDTQPACVSSSATGDLFHPETASPGCVHVLRLNKNQCNRCFYRHQHSAVPAGWRSLPCLPHCRAKRVIR